MQWDDQLMAITEEQVTWAYRMFLDREPETEQVVRSQMEAYADLAAIRKEFATSGEFKALTESPKHSFIPHFLMPPSQQGRIYIDLPSLAHPGSQMCTFSQLQEPDFARICEAIGLDASIAHRKHWEWAYICRVLELGGMIQPGKRGLVFAVGRERLPAYFASQGVDILATDGPKDVADIWVSSDQFSDDERALWYPEIISEEEFRKRIKFRVADMINLPPDLGIFDFLWSSCSMEHLGGIQPGFDFVLNSLAFLNPGGIAVHTTEFNLSSNEETLDCWPTCIYRKQDIDAFISEVKSLGHQVLPLNYFSGSDPLDVHIDYPPHAPPHLKMALAQYVTTSFGFAIIKKHD
jgi:hypothetical protein